MKIHIARIAITILIFEIIFLGVLSVLGGSNKYSKEYENNFMNACLQNSAQQTCNCALNAVERNYTMKQAVKAELGDQQLARDIVATIASKCS